MNNFLNLPIFRSPAQILKRNLASKNLIRVINQHDHVELIVSGMSAPLKINSHWLRMNCHSLESKQKSTGQRTIDVNKVPDDLIIEKLTYDDKTLTIKWETRANQPETKIPIKFLLDQPNYEAAKKSRDMFESCRKIEFLEFDDIKSNREQRLKWLLTIAKYGLCVVRNVPKRSGMVKELAELIAPVSTTIYDQVFDVKVDENPINIAYSNSPLGLHMDLMYYESSPGIQFLHCLKFDESIRGGESIFLDVFEAVEQFAKQHPNHFNVLTRIPATFQKIHLNRSRPVMMIYRRPHIIQNDRGRVTAVNWSPPFEGPLTQVTYEESKAYYAAYLTFSKFLDNHPFLIQYRLEPGEVACFNNRRVLHGRNGFESTRSNAIRHFQGCYLNIDEFKSEVYVSEYLARDDWKSNEKLETANQLEAHRFMYGNQDF